MSAEERQLFEIAARVSDGMPVDWDSEESSAPNEKVRRQIRHLRLLESVSRTHRSVSTDGMSTVSPLDVTATLDTASLKPQGSRPVESEPAPSQWGRLEIREKLGEGGFGDVYRAWDVNLDREVALKLLRSRIMSDDARAGTVLEEGRMLARVRHPNVITVHGAETHDGRVGLWMELVRGRTLAHLMREQGRFGAREAALIGIELCRALAAVHGAGLVHRDIKAENVMRDEGGRFLLMDFGAGQQLDDLVGRSDSRISGTPLYIAPEIFEGRPATARSDIYSMGILLYHLVTESFPVMADSVAELRAEHQRQSSRLLRDERSDLPESFVQVVERALARDPQRRFATAGQMEQALSASLGVEGAPEVAAAPPSVELTEPRRPRTAAVVLALALAALVLGLGGWWISGLLDDSPERRAETDAPSAAAVGSASTYSVQAALYRKSDDGRERLESGASLKVGDELGLEMRASRDLHVYVFNEDAKGNAFALFPMPGLELQNPLPANETHVLPGRRDGKWIRWQVSSAGDREHLIVLASPEPLTEFEREMSRLARPSPGAIAIPVPAEARERLRGIGGLVESTEPGLTDDPDRLFQMARRLAGQAELVEGVWMREIELDNPE